MGIFSSLLHLHIYRDIDTLTILSIHFSSETKTRKLLAYHGIDSFNISFGVENVFEHAQYDTYDRILCGAECPEMGMQIY